VGLTIFLAYLFTYPNDILSDTNIKYVHTDVVPSVWVFNWYLKSLAAGEFGRLFTGNLFYPLQDSIFFNENLLSTAALSVPVFWLTGDSYFCYRLAIFASFILCSLGMYLLARQLRISIFASILAAFIFSFSGYRYSIITYGHFAAMQWMPFTLLFAHKYFDQKRPCHLYWAALFFGLQVTASAHYFILFSLFVSTFVVILCIQNNVLLSRSFYRDAALPVILVLVPAVLIYFPYSQVSQNYGFKRTIADQVFYGLPLSSFFSFPNSYFLQPLTGGPSVGGSYPPGYTALLLTGVAIFILRKNVSPLSWIRKFNIIIFIAFMLTLILWQFRLDLAEEALKRFPFLYDNPTVVPTAILSPFLILIVARLGVSQVARSLWAGLKTHKTLFLYTFLALMAFAVSLGPAIKTDGQNYLMANPVGIFLYLTFPGIAAIRAISRMGGLIPLGIGISAAVGFLLARDKFTSKIKKGIFSAVILLLILLESFPVKGFNRPYQAEEIKIPEVYKWFKSAPGEGAVFEWSSTCSCDIEYTRWSLYHMKPIVNGYGSWRWEGHEKITQLTDLSTLDALHSLDAIGMRYLFIHTQSSSFPVWAQETLGNFHLVKKFKNTLVYEKKKARPQFLPDDYWKIFSVSYQSRGEISLTFLSPDKYYVSREKKILPIEIHWEDGSVQHTEIILYPTLWRDGDVYSQVIEPKGRKVSSIVIGSS